MRLAPSRFGRDEESVSRRLSLSVLFVFALTSDLLEHLNRRDTALIDTDETIINGDNKLAPKLGRCDIKLRSNCVTSAAGARALRSVSNSHYDLIVPTQQIPYGEECQIVGLVLPRADANSVGHSSVNDNQETTNGSRESQAGVGEDHYSIRPRPIMNHLQNSAQQEAAVNPIKPSRYETFIRASARFSPSRTKLRRRKWWSWSIIGQAEAIRLTRLEAPHSVQAGQQLKLRCLYETRGDKLQSLALYRNGREFYRFQPFERRQPVLAFNSTGVHVDLARSRNHTVYLTNTTLETSGRYRCEATGTTFQESKLETYIEVTPASSAVRSSGYQQSQITAAVSISTQIACFILSHINHSIKF